MSGPRVLLATPFELTARPNGGTLRTWALAETLTTAGAEVVVLAPGASVLPRGAGSLADVARTGSRTLGQRALEALGPGPTTGRTARRRLGADFERLLGDRRVDVAILAHTAAAWALWPRAAGAGVPWVLDLYDVEERRTRELVRHASPVRRPLAAVDARRTRIAERDLLRRAPLVSCVSEADEAHVRSLGQSRVVLAPNGVSDRLFALEPPVAGCSWLFLGDLSYGPNVRGLLWLRDRVLPLLPPRADRALRVAGRRPDAELRRWAAADPRVELVGDPEDVAPLLEQSTFCLTPVHEGGGTSLKVLEYAAAARPFVSTSAGSRGFPALPGVMLADTAESFSRAMLELESQPDPALAAAGLRRRAGTLTWPSVLAELVTGVQGLARR